MRYIANALPNNDDGPFCATVSPDRPIFDEALAARHARAMAAVLRASKVWRRTNVVYRLASMINRDTDAAFKAGAKAQAAYDRLTTAVARLEKVEKEVSR